MNIEGLFANQKWVDLAVKSFGIIFALIYILFALVMYKQTQIMNHTLQTRWGKLIIFISFFQIVFSLVVFGYAVLFI